MKKQIVGAFLLLILLLSCGSSSTITISKADFDERFEAAKSQVESQGMVLNEEQLEQLKEDVMTQIIERSLLLAEAQNQEIEINNDEVEAEYISIQNRFPSAEVFAEQMELFGYTEEKLKAEIAENMQIQMLIDGMMAEVELDEADITAYYNDNKDRFVNPETVRASHILIQTSPEDDETTRADALRRIKLVLIRAQQGDDFAELAKEFSEGPSGPQGGDLGPFGRGQMVPPFEEAAFALEVGEVSEVVETSFGYHIIKLFEKNEQTVVPFEEARGFIEDQLRQEKGNELIINYIDELKEVYTIKEPKV
jgi:peptidyl-prolyl cis-trans isomerase C